MRRFVWVASLTPWSLPSNRNEPRGRQTDEARGDAAGAPALVLPAFGLFDRAPHDVAADEAEGLRRERLHVRVDEAARRPFVGSFERERGEDPPADIRGADAVAGVPDAVEHARVLLERAEDGQARAGAIDGTGPRRRDGDVGE